jgi:uncharacterized protein involved in response to NO
MQRSLLLHGEVPQPDSRPRFALARKGFRPFFLLAALFGATIVPEWLLVLGGFVHPSAYLPPPLWHAHEMVFGFTVAVIAGFLLTAVGNWTQRETLVGAPLLALAALWVTGRVCILFAGELPRGVPAAVDLSFLPLLVVALARPLVAARNRRNFVMLLVLAALFAANLVVHLAALGAVSGESARTACLAAIDVVVVVILLIAGRVFPMFTRNATGSTDIRSHPRLDVLTVVGMASLTVVDAVAPGTVVSALLAGVVGALAIARAWGWKTRRVARHPLLWILHAGYAWLCVGLLLRAAAPLQTLPPSLATHALTVGAIGSLTLGMMARVALGHTGRPLVVPRSMVAAFVFMTAAAAVRVVGPLLGPESYFVTLLLAGAFWTAAFLVFLAVYFPVLTSPRADGKAG